MTERGRLMLGWLAVIIGGAMTIAGIVWMVLLFV